MTIKRTTNPVMMTAEQAVLERAKIRCNTRQEVLQEVLQRISTCVRTASAGGHGSVTLDTEYFSGLDNAERRRLIDILEEHGYTVWWPRWFGRWSAKMVVSWE